MSRFVKFIFLLSMSLSVLVPEPSWAASPDHWVGTWAMAPMATTIYKNDAAAKDETLRQIMHVSLGGSMERVVVSNVFGLDPLDIGAAQIALRGSGSDIQIETANALTFNGKSSVAIPAGGRVVSDPVALKLPALSDVVISLFIPAQPMRQITEHAGTTSYLAAGNQVAARNLDGAAGFRAWRFVTDIEVMANATSGAIVMFGDSITDGVQSTRDANARWPDVLARRLQGDPKTAGLGVLNEGISGNRLLHDITGPSALSRFDRDVLGQTGVRYVIVLEGINDIGHTTQPVRADDTTTTQKILAALQQLIDRAHARGLKVFGATLTPYAGAKYASSPDGEVMREAENAFIRSGKFDAVIDFDKATQDPTNPLQLLPAYDSGDHLHPNDAGYKAMGESIDLSLFK